MNNQTVHTPVLLEPIIRFLDPQPGKSYIDATLGAAGHTKTLLSKGATVLGIDQDEQILALVRDSVASDHLTLANANFMTIKTQAEKFGFTKVDGILFDLGVSSYQLDQADRGFSFQQTAPLDMRMNQQSGITAADLINQASEDELYEMLMINSQEPKSRQIAQAIIKHRPMATTTQLADIITKVYGSRRSHLHPATLTFQALRIAVNQELKVLSPALKDAFALLKPGGRLAVISFHEGEDRIVKRFFNSLSESKAGELLVKTPITASKDEVINNPRSRSAKLRLIERTT